MVEWGKGASTGSVDMHSGRCSHMLARTNKPAPVVSSQYPYNRINRVFLIAHFSSDCGSSAIVNPLIAAVVMGGEGKRCTESISNCKRGCCCLLDHCLHSLTGICCKGLHAKWSTCKMIIKMLSLLHSLGIFLILKSYQ